MSRNKYLLTIALGLLTTVLISGTAFAQEHIYINEGFDGTTFPPTGWTNTIISGASSDTWKRVPWFNDLAYPMNYPYYGKAMAWYGCNYFPSGSGARLATPAIDLSSAPSSTKLKFYTYLTNDWPTYYDSLFVDISTDGGTNWTNLAKYNRYTPACPGWDLKTISLASYVGSGMNNIKISFRAKSNYGYNLSIDNVVVASGLTMLSGTKTIGQSGDYPSFSAAVNDLVLRGMNGNLTFLVTPGIYTDSIIVPKVESLGRYTLTFKGNGGQATIQRYGVNEQYITDAVVTLYGADYVTFDSINVAQAGVGNLVEYGYRIINNGPCDGATHNTIKNGSVTLNPTNPGSYGYGILLASNIYWTFPSPASEAGASSYNKFYNLTINNCNVGIYILGGDMTHSGTYPDLNNEIGTTGGGTTTIGSSTKPIGAYAIRTATQKGLKVFNVRASYCGVCGIFLESDKGSSVYNCKVDSIRSPSTAATAMVYGIRAEPSASTDTSWVYNNMIWNLSNGAYASATSIRIRGLGAGAGSGVLQAHYNTVYLNATNNTGSAAFYMSGVNARVLNNVLVNTSSTPSTNKHYAFYKAGGTIVTSNNNDLYVDTLGTGAFVGYDGTSDRATLAAWRTATGQDGQSVSEHPSFVAPATDLHINTAVATRLESGGQPILGITTDIDGDARHSTHPDIGADEFNGATPGVITLPLSIVTNQKLAVNPNPFTKLTTIHYTVPVSGKVSLKLYNTTGRLVETLINEPLNAGTYELKIENWKLKISKGVYFLRYEDMTNRAEVKLIVK